MKRTVAIAVGLFLLVSGLSATAAFATTRSASSESELRAAITAAATGDTINLTADIVLATSQLALGKALTIDGHGYTVSVAKPGVTEAGANAISPSTFRAFELTGAVTITLKNMRIKGGNTQGAAVRVSSLTTAILDGVTISNSRNSTPAGYNSNGGSGGIYNLGTTYLRNSNVVRNSAYFGGGFVNGLHATMFIENSTITDNRGEGWGGAAGENDGTMFVSNSSFANNSSMEIGGALNNTPDGALYVSGSSFTGNVAYGSYGGGAIGNNTVRAGGTVIVTSSLFAYNYSRSAGTTAAPSAFALDDVGLSTLSYTTGARVSLFYSVFHAPTSSSLATIGSTNSRYTGAADGSDNTLFTGGSLSKIRNGAGGEIGTASVFRPFIVVKNGRYAPALTSNSFAANKGTPVRYSATGSTSYYDRLAGSPSWISLTPAVAASGDLVSVDQYGETRNATTPAAGSVESEVVNQYQVRAVQVDGGTVSGASIYGDAYVANTKVTVTAVPDPGKTFDHFVVTTSGTTFSAGVYAAIIPTSITSNPLVYTVTADAVVEPVFVSSSAGERTVSYGANETTCGAPPAAVKSSSAISIAANSGTSMLQREGYDFSGWNTEPNGSGIDYAAGASYSTASNLSLYAKWNANSSVTTTCFSVTVTPTPTPSPPPTPAVSPSPTPTASTGEVTTSGSDEASQNSSAEIPAAGSQLALASPHPEPSTSALASAAPSAIPNARQDVASAAPSTPAAEGLLWVILGLAALLSLLFAVFLFILTTRRHKS
jgi:uncharacterized repeat protein (TIGR02543 family)